MGGEGELEGVEDVLPDDVGSGTEGGHGVEESVRHPDTERGVLLTKSLSGGDAGDTRHSGRSSGRINEDILVVFAFARRREMVADELAQTKLN